MTRCIVMYSGGLDSTVAVHLLKSQGLDVLALHFILPFYSGLGSSYEGIRASAAALGVPIRVEEEGDDFLEMIKNPEFGFGKNVNPCLDCRIYRLTKARKIMEEESAAFIATGEVVGQRPMSQRRDSMNTVKNLSGLGDRLLRPLSAKILEPTAPELQGLVDREKLLSIGGRGRKEQIAYAKQFGLAYAAPAGGCLLTLENTRYRYLDLQKHTPDFSLNDFRLMAYGRHFRINPHLHLIVSRMDHENIPIEKSVLPDDYRFEMADTLGPLGLARGIASVEDLRLCAGLLARYSRLRGETSVRFNVSHAGIETMVSAKPATDEVVEQFRVKTV